MVGSLVFVLTLLGFALLMVAERIGLSASWGLEGIHMVLALAVLALGLGSVTSRFARFADGGVSLMVRCACVLVALITFAPAGVELHSLVPGFAAGFAVAHFGWQRLPPSNTRARRIAGLLLGLAFGVVALVLLRPLLGQLSRVLLLDSLSMRLVFGALVLAVLLPGGALGVGRVQRHVLALALVGALMPPAALGVLVGLEKSDPLSVEMLGALVPLGKTAISDFHLAFSGLVVGAVGGLVGRGTQPTSHASAALGVVGAALVASVLILHHLVAAEWLARVVGQRIAGLAPASWPPFVFEPELSGWLRACGVQPANPLAAARACGLTSPLEVPKPADITFLATLSMRALAGANRLPAALGAFWGLLPVLLGSMGLLSLLHGAAVAFSESVLFGLFNPSGLQSFRLAMARLSLLALVLALLAVDTLPRLPAASLTSVLAILLGGAAFLLALAGLRRAPAEEHAA